MKLEYGNNCSLDNFKSFLLTDHINDFIEGLGLCFYLLIVIMVIVVTFGVALMNEEIKSSRKLVMEEIKAVQLDGVDLP